MSTCEERSNFDGLMMGARIASIFVLLAVSSFGAFFPLLANKWSFIKLPTETLFLVRHFGTGVILATAFIHLLGEAQTSLSSPCLTGIWTEYSWASGISLMGTFTMFTIDLAVLQYVCRTQRFRGASEYENSCHNDVQGYGAETLKSGDHHPQQEAVRSNQNSHDVKIEMSGEPHNLSVDEHAFKKLASLFLLEFGIVFHSVFVGLALAISGDEFKTLL